MTGLTNHAPQKKTADKEVARDIETYLSDIATETDRLRNFARFRVRVIRAQKLHPEGASFLALLSEVAELGYAILFEHHVRVVDEAFDVAVVAYRYAIGERKGAR